MNAMKLLMYILLWIAVPVSSWSRKESGLSGNRQPVQVLVVGLDNNVKSNYYVKDMIAEETGIMPDSIAIQFNQMLSQHIQNFDGKNEYIFKGSNADLSKIISSKISVAGEGEQCSSDLSGFPGEELDRIMLQAGADYLLVLNQHYFKWQEEPMKTVFHIVSYSLYNKERKQIHSGNQYYTTIKLESADKMRQFSRKSGQRIASSVAKAIDR